MYLPLSVEAGRVAFEPVGLDPILLSSRADPYELARRGLIAANPPAGRNPRVHLPESKSPSTDNPGGLRDTNRPAKLGAGAAKCDLRAVRTMAHSKRRSPKADRSDPGKLCVDARQAQCDMHLRLRLSRTFCFELCRGAEELSPRESR
jgi:hypothetical protein